MKTENMKPLVSCRGIWHDVGIVKKRVHCLVFAVASLCYAQCGNASTAQTLAEYQSIGYWDALSLTQKGYIKNNEDVDSRCIIPLGFPVAWPLLSLSATVEVGENSSAWIAFGNEGNPESLKLGLVNSQWTVLVGDSLRGFSDPLPTPLAGTHTYRIRVLADLQLGASEITVSVDGAQTTQSVPSVPPSAWPQIDPSGWTHATISLRNEAQLNGLSMALKPRATLIIVR